MAVSLFTLFFNFVFGTDLNFELKLYSSTLSLNFVFGTDLNFERASFIYTVWESWLASRRSLKIEISIFVLKIK
jgi:hypothetical protein